MSYNIDSVLPQVLEAHMNAEDIIRIHDTVGLPEVSFIERHLKEARAFSTRACTLCKARNDTDAKFCKGCGVALHAKPSVVVLQNFAWCGEGSGSTFDDLFQKVVPFVKGTVEAVLVWEGGDTIDGLLVKDGKARRVDVDIVLKRPAKW